MKRVYVSDAEGVLQLFPDPVFIVLVAGGLAKRHPEAAWLPILPSRTKRGVCSK